MSFQTKGNAAGHLRTHSRYFPLIVSLPLFLQNIDLTAMATALPTMARSLNVPVLHLNTVIAAYAIGLAAFLPLSAWFADRFGAKRTFCSAIIVFSLASALCGTATTAPLLVVYRVIQGFGGAMMIPVGRLILLRSVKPAELVHAMVWFTVPPTIGRLAGPLAGGLIVNFTSWRWIFFVNIPLGIAAFALAVTFLDDTNEAEARPGLFDATGFLMMALGLGGLLSGLETLGRDTAPQSVSISLVLVGAALLGAYSLYAQRQKDPLIDLRILRFHTFRINIIGAAPLRLAISAIPFILPLMFQIGFRLSPLTSGLLMSAAAIGSLTTRFAMRRLLEKLSFKRVIVAATALTAVVYSGYALFRPSTPYWIISSGLFFGGLLGSLCFVALNTFGFDEMPKERISHGTALLAMTQQVMAAVSVVFAAILMSAFSWSHGGDGLHLGIRDFAATVLTVSALSLLSVWSFASLAPYQRFEAKEEEELLTADR